MSNPSFQMKRRGFTLIELLAAVVILMLICGLLALSISQISRLFDQRVQSLNQNQNLGFTMYLLKKDLENADGWIVQNRAVDYADYQWISKVKGYEGNRQFTLVRWTVGSVDEKQQGLVLRRTVEGGSFDSDSVKNLKTQIDNKTFLSDRYDNLSEEVFSFAIEFSEDGIQWSNQDSDKRQLIRVSVGSVPKVKIRQFPEFNEKISEWEHDRLAETESPVVFWEKCFKEVNLLGKNRIEPVYKVFYIAFPNDRLKNQGKTNS